MEQDYIYEIGDEVITDFGFGIVLDKDMSIAGYPVYSVRICNNNEGWWYTEDELLVFEERLNFY